MSSRGVRWPDDCPPLHSDLYGLGQRCLDEVNAAARVTRPTTQLEIELVDLFRSQAIAIGYLADELLRLRREVEAEPTA